MRALTDITLAVGADAFKRAVHIPAEDSDDQFLIHDLLAAAQQVVETAARHVLTPRSVEFMARAGMGLRWWVPVKPVQAVESVQIWTGTDWAAVSPDLVRLEFGHDEPQLIFSDLAFADVEQGAPMRIALTCGHSALVRPLGQALIMLANSWYQDGISIEGGAQDAAAAAMPFGVRALIRQARYQRPCEWAAA